MSAESGGDSLKSKISLYGLGMALLCVLLWGIQPFFMKTALIHFDPYTVSWVRLTFAGIATLIITRKKIAHHREALSAAPLILILGGVCLAANYFTFLRSLDLGGALTAAVLIQVGPLILALVGVFFYRETFTRIQAIAVVVALVGFLAFYKDRLNVANTSGLQDEAALTVIFSAVLWVGYCIVQKQVAGRFGSVTVNLVAYIVSSFLLVFLVDWSTFQHFYTWSFFAVAYLSCSTLAAYTALGEALRTLPASIVSMLIVTNPFVTIAVVELLALFETSLMEVTPLTTLGYVGSIVAIIGVAAATVHGVKKEPS